MKKILFIIIIIALIIVGILLIPINNDTTKVHLKPFDRNIRELKLIDSIEYKTESTDFLLTNNGIIQFEIQSSQKYPIIKLINNEEKIINVGKEYVYCRSAFEKNDSAIYILQKNDSFWIAKTYKDVLYDVRIVPEYVGYENSIVTALDLYHICFSLVKVNKNGQADDYVMRISNILTEDAWDIIVSDIYKEYAEKIKNFYHAGFQGYILKNSTGILYKNLYSSNGFLFNEGQFKISKFNTIDNLDFSYIENKKVANGTLTELSPCIIGVHDIEYFKEKYYFVSIMDRSNDDHVFVDVYDDNMQYLYSYCPQNLKYNGMFSIQLSDSENQAIYLKDNFAKKIYKYEM